MKNLRKLREEHGAGEWGTPELTNKYKSETPGQQQDEGHEEDAQAAHKAAHAALKKGDIDTYHKEMDKKFASHQAAAEIAAKKPVKTFEQAFTPNQGLLDRIKKDHDELKGMSTKDVHRVHQGQYKVRSSYTPAEVGGKQGMIADILRNRHGDKHVSHYFGTNESTTTIEKPVAEDSDEQKNLKITKHEKAAVEAGKRGDRQAQQYHLNIVKNTKANESVNEAAEKKDVKHLVTVTVSDPHHAMQSKRKEKIMKRVRVSAADPKTAVAKAEAHYKKHGYKVHDSLHHSIVESLDTDEFIDSYDPEQQKNESTDSHEAQEIAMAKGQFAEMADMARELADAMDDIDELQPWMHAKITTAYVNLDDVHSYVTYSDEYSNDNSSEDETSKENIGEATEQDGDGEETQAGLSDEEKTQIGKIKTLIRLGLIDNSQMQVTLRAVKKLDLDQPVTSSAERQAINVLLQQLIGVVTGDDAVFRKIRLNVQK